MSQIQKLRLNYLQEKFANPLKQMHAAQSSIINDIIEADSLN